MLQQILKDMYIDPDVLEALNEEQKKTLFLKMRQEQVRRWKEREEKLEREGGDAESTRTQARKVNSKSVTWQLGRDGDVSVLVIGEVDELTSKFINSGFGDKKSPSLPNSMHHQTIVKSQKITQEVKSECQSIPPKTQPGISLNLKEKREENSTLRPLPLQEQAPSPTEGKSVSQPPMCSRPPTRGSPVVRPASANSTPGSINDRPGLGNLKLAAPTPSSSSSSSSTVRLDPASASSAKGSLCSKEPVGKDSALEKFRRADSVDAEKSLTATTCTRRGRVADLMKTFSVDTPPLAQSRPLKPPLPTKPDHLRLTTTPTVR
ncbi:SH2 domain-containing protein 4A [Fundulus heteroclitus]|uniref:SH2 domain-containing protein 4A n=1 Tax=Fundulus heteroclitus TaxID=8078 RepID=UPI00165BE443|nr:SH2 domain-containing protein 4A [Fundulus heteroclitus]XP_035999037.1 SH2 domain-containing protein 4A [Fundulus heteroclitus]XP_035999038.1 SH2 domain-containing protein 4A [Fundulus heteroclitus]